MAWFMLCRSYKYKKVDIPDMLQKRRASLASTWCESAQQRRSAAMLSRGGENPMFSMLVIFVKTNKFLSVYTKLW